MSIVFDILHLTIAAVLAVIGMGYEREDQDCTPPVRLDPAAQFETMDLETAAEANSEITMIAECDNTL